MVLIEHPLRVLKGFRTMLTVAVKHIPIDTDEMRKVLRVTLKGHDTSNLKLDVEMKKRHWFRKYRCEMTVQKHDKVAVKFKSSAKSPEDAFHLSKLQLEQFLSQLK